LEPNKAKKKFESNSKGKKHNYPKTEKELQLVREFVIKYIARSRARGEKGKFSLESVK